MELYDRVCLNDASRAYFLGKEASKLEPNPGVEVKLTLPLYFAAACLTMDKPRPVLGLF